MVIKKLFYTSLLVTLVFTGCSQTNHDSTNSLDQSSEILDNSFSKEPDEEEFVFTYECLNTTEFWFGSGAGAWCTTLRINNDGSFYGEYSDTDAGSISSEAPNGTRYYCAFHGQLGNLEKIDNLTYKTTIDSISYDNPKDTDEIVDGMHYFYTEPYGLENTTDIYFYLPGKNVNTIDSEEYSWIGKDFYDAPYETEGWYLPFVVLANSNMHYAFHGYDFTQHTIDACEKYNYDYPIPLQEDTSEAPHTAKNQSGNENNTSINETQISDNNLSVGSEHVLKSTINIRLQPDTSSDKLAIAYKDEIITIKSESINGWIEVVYNGKTGYVRSELLQ